MLDDFSVTTRLDGSDVVLISLDGSALMDGDVASRASSSSRDYSIDASMLIDLSASFVNLTLFLSEVGVLIYLFSSFG